MQCHTGCNDCCHVQLSVTAIEKAAILEGLNALAPKMRNELAQNAQNPDPQRCSALNREGKCIIYAFRPLFCRSHGLPIRMSNTIGLPMAQDNSISACFRNFISDGVGSLAPDCILDQRTLSTILHVINRAYAEETGEDPEQRSELATIFKSAADHSG